MTTLYKLIFHQARIMDVPFGGRQAAITNTFEFGTASSTILEDRQHSVFCRRMFNPGATGDTSVVEEPCYLMTLWLPEGTRVEMTQEAVPDIDPNKLTLPKLPTICPYPTMTHWEEQDMYKLQMQSHKLPNFDIVMHQIFLENSDVYFEPIGYCRHPIQLQHEGYTTFTLDFTEAEEDFHSVYMYTFFLDEYIPIE